MRTGYSSLCTAPHRHIEEMKGSVIVLPPVGSETTHRSLASLGMTTLEKSLPRPTDPQQRGRRSPGYRSVGRLTCVVVNLLRSVQVRPSRRTTCSLQQRKDEWETGRSRSGWFFQNQTSKAQTQWGSQAGLHPRRQRQPVVPKASNVDRCDRLRP